MLRLIHDVRRVHAGWSKKKFDRAPDRHIGCNRTLEKSQPRKWRAPCAEFGDGRVVKVRLSKDYNFEAAHTLPNVPPDHKCARMHGHSYKITVTVEGPVGEASGWLMDHSEISDVVKPVIAELDHRYLNDFAGLENPTFERLAGWLWERLAPGLPGLAEIVVHETPTARCIYRGEQ